MKVLADKSHFVLAVCVIFFLFGCVSRTSGHLEITDYDKEHKLREHWREYVVYYRNGALLFKIKTAGKIELDNNWVEITTEKMMKKTVIWDSVQVDRILGQDRKLYGYLVHRIIDVVYLTTINETTIKLDYTYIVPSGGP